MIEISEEIFGKEMSQLHWTEFFWEANNKMKYSNPSLFAYFLFAVLLICGHILKA
jgi:hypothetical protein